MRLPGDDAPRGGLAAHLLAQPLEDDVERRDEEHTDAGRRDHAAVATPRRLSVAAPVATTSGARPSEFDDRA
jgi:hypothetical protein